MKSILKSYIDKSEVIDCIKYHALIELFGKENVDQEINNYVEERLNSDFSFENQKRLWDRFGYYFSTLDSSIFEKIAIKNIKKDYIRSDDVLSLVEEKKYGYHLLCRDYLMICSDKQKNKVDMEKVFGSICSVKVRDLILNCFDELYKNISRVSNYDKEMKDFLDNYKKLCISDNIPYLSYDGDLISEDILLEQVMMYVRYSIAKDKLIRNNLGLIRKVCVRINHDLSNEDLFNEGYLGLVKSINYFDVRRGILFYTFAIKGIKFAIWNFQMQDEKLLKLPFNKESLGYKINNFSYDFYSINGRYPTYEEIAIGVGISLDDVWEIKKFLFKNEYSSLDVDIIVDEVDSCNFIDIISDDKNDYDKVILKDYFNYVLKIMEDKLDEREKLVLLDRAFGKTLIEISKILNVSKERVRQIENGAIKKLMRVSSINKVNPFN